jgi:hypothetical protein
MVSYQATQPRSPYAGEADRATRADVTNVDQAPLPPGGDTPAAPSPLSPRVQAAEGGSDDFKVMARRRERRVALVLGPLLLLGLAFGAGYATAYDDGEELAAAERRINRQDDQIDRLGDSVDNVTTRWQQEQAMNEEVRAELQRVQTEVQDQQAALEARATDLDAREADLDARVAAAEANTFGNGIHQVGRDIQPGQYHTDGSAGGCYYALLTAPSGPGVDHIIDNNNISGPATLVIESPYFETSGGCTWTKIG